MAYTGADQNERVTSGSHNYLNGGNLGGVPTIDADQNTAASTEFFTRTPDGVLLAETVYGGGAGQFYYTLDNLNSVRQLTNSSGTVTATYTYDPYGNTTSAAPPSSVHNPYGYTDKTGLIKFGARYYAPSLQRWTQQDPSSGHTSSPLTTNRYIYAGDAPEDHADPSGQSSIDIQEIAEACEAEAAGAALLGLYADGIQGATTGLLLGCSIGAVAETIDEITGTSIAGVLGAATDFALAFIL